MMIYSPLEQFEISPIMMYFFGDAASTSATKIHVYAFSTGMLALATAVIALVIFLEFSTFSIRVVPRPWQILGEKVYGFVYSDIATQQVGRGVNLFFPLIFTVFVFVLMSNFVGLVPFSFTTTSHLAVTFGLGLALFAGINILAVNIHGMRFLTLFYPKDAPLSLAPLIVVIELISYVFRVLSLSVRLFANMMSGHALLKILLSFAWLAFSQAFFSVSSAILLIIFGVMVLESGIAFVQAYVFTVLVCLYLKEGLYLH
jgi:ATP synthase subunit 6|tara:strand:+ start:820 stop:1593 length:774 start_codon:yes stop_codon:yes gene_type:complete